MQILLPLPSFLSFGECGLTCTSYDFCRAYNEEKSLGIIASSISVIFVGFRISVQNGDACLAHVILCSNGVYGAEVRDIELRQIAEPR